ncbi:MAG: 6-carboxytetrahydropterin synthase [Bacteroidetes bacterium]|nr:MAG: 6-carboxytetrahydropterin synthase [Bacteroidota bacterium]MBL1145212.1 6-carboxytetrahydropterin synthase [Bacteroidota bacterium]MCB0803616.1 6-carboxytetrahydropterin synthase [Flavobacteriales bacterium]NOG58008.1 6-carboxytetrahydropterin synthase [Bacteroidota bacterium]
MVYITRRERFSAAHKLAIPAWSEEQNFKTFGKCANPNWHGHNYTLYVTVKGIPEPSTGFVVDLSTLGDIIKEEVIQHVDHKNLNLDVEFTKHLMTSTENLAIAFWQRLESRIAEIGGVLHCIKLQETENNYVEYYGE